MMDAKNRDRPGKASEDRIPPTTAGTPTRIKVKKLVDDPSSAGPPSLYRLEYSIAADCDMVAATFSKVEGDSPSSCDDDDDCLVKVNGGGEDKI